MKNALIKTKQDEWEVKQTEWDKHYSRLTRAEPEPEPVHWGWRVLGAAIAMTLIAWIGVWIAVGLAV